MSLYPMPVKTPLYQQPLNQCLESAAPIGLATAKVCGANAGNLQYTDLDSINGCRMTKGAKNYHRIAADVKPCSGYVNESRRGAMTANTSNYSRKELRGLAVKVLRDRGIQINEKNIQGILSGRML